MFITNSEKKNSWDVKCHNGKTILTLRSRQRNHRGDYNIKQEVKRCRKGKYYLCTIDCIGQTQVYIQEITLDECITFSNIDIPRNMVRKVLVEL